MDPIQPVGAMVQPPQPINPLQTYAGILGIKQQQVELQQQQQNLQTGAYKQQQEQAGAQEQQEMMRERQLLQQAQASGKDDQGNPLNGPDGEPDAAAVTKFAMRALPLLGQGIVQNIVKTQTDRANLYRANLSLSNEQRETAAGKVRAAIGTGMTSDQIISQVQQALGTDSSAVANVKSLKPLLSTIDGVQDQQSRDKMLTHIANFYSPQAQVAASQTSAPVQSFAPHGGGIQLTEGNQFAPGGVGASLGPTTPVGLGPTQTPDYQRAISGAAATGGGVASDDATRYKQISDAGQMAQTGQTLAREVSLLADGVRTGKMSGEITDWLTAIRQKDPGLTDRQLLAKYAANLRRMADQGASTDAERSGIDAGMPDPEKMGPDAIADAAKYMGGMFSMYGARQKIADSYVKNHGGATDGIRQVDDDFMRHADPQVFAFKGMAPGPDRVQWALRHGYGGQDGAQRLRQQLMVLDHYGAFQ